MPIPRNAYHAPAFRQHGITMLTTLIALVILLVSSIALVRSFDVSVILSGNMSFKRDMVNRGEIGMAKAMALFASGGVLAAESARIADSLANNYSSSVLSSNSRGIPKVLLSDALFASSGMTAADVTDSASGVTIRYVIDRQCNAAGAFSTSTCAFVEAASDTGGTSGLKKAGGGYLSIYRVSIRVTGPRNTQTYLQTTLSR